MCIEEVDPTTKKTVSSMCNGSEEHTKYWGIYPQTREAVSQSEIRWGPNHSAWIQTQHTAGAKSGAQVGDTAFVLVVLTTNHVRNKVNLEVK